MSKKTIRDKLHNVLDFTRAFVPRYTDFSQHCEETRNAIAKLRFYGNECARFILLGHKIKHEEIQEMKKTLVQIAGDLYNGLLKDLYVDPPFPRCYSMSNHEKKVVRERSKDILSILERYPFDHFME